MDVQTRSLSSSIVEFFKKPIEKREQDNKDIGNDQALDRMLPEGGILPDGQGSLILYETNSQLRPPVLPILPVQRLRLLRYRQEMRRRLGSDVLLSVNEPRRMPRLSLLDTSYSRQNSSTPSPVKAAGTAEPVETLQVLKSRKMGNNQREGTRWSGSFDYDLSEYDNHRKEGKPVATVVRKDHIDSPSITATKMAASPGGMFQDINVSSLSAAQRDVLLKGQPISAVRQPVERESTIVAGRNQGDAKDARQDKTVLPSLGFDFIKPSDTPSKTGDIESIKIKQKKVENGSLQFKPVEQPSKLASVLPAAKPSFNFTNLKSNVDQNAHRPREDEEEKEEPRRKKATRFTDTTTSLALSSSSSSSGQDNNKPTFSFGNAVAGTGVTADKGTKMVASAGKQASQPLFKFGKPNEENEKKETSKIGSVPSFSFGAKQSDQVQLNGSSLGNDIAKSTKTAFSFGSGPESAAQESATDKSSEKISDDSTRKSQDDVTATQTTQAPIFSFSANGRAADVGKTSSAADQGTTDKRDSSTSTAFSFGPSTAPGLKDKSTAPSFTFGSSTTSDNKSQPVAAPSFSFNGSTTSGKEDKAPNATPSFSFGSATAEKKGTSLASSFAFGKSVEPDNKDKAAAPSFSFGKSVEPDNKDKAAAPSFSFGKSAEPDNKDKAAAPSFSFGNSAASDNKEKAQTPSFSFGSSAASDNKEKAQTTSFSFGTNAAPEKKETTSFSFGTSASVEKKDQPVTAPSFSFGSVNGKSASPSLPTNGFSFKKATETADGATEKPSFSFGVTDTAKSGGSVFGTSAAQSNPSVTNNANFTFNKPSTGINVSGSDNKAGLPSIDFKFGATTNNENNTAVATAPTTNPFLGTSQNNNNGFSFNISGNTNPNVGGQPPQPAFGTTPSPAFGRSASPIVMNGSNSSSRAFTPSNTINMNFSNNATINPSSIFAAKPNVPNMATNGPQQFFSTAPPPSQVFGAAPQSNGIAPGQLAQPAQQTPALNFQLPPGRKLARMRQSRR
ncbi:hypothetical protein HG537_0C03530 [Torulaspora globosa]|uniref:Nuclear pore complex NUP2/50/61 domain-containing protein n=1 Tax=Torulaspora globosa TaxID=48254 RepID=A0A7H9HTH2_9SACH|nr:hypothetical protein HG537_0C03530 [Torulaspora sp. CBS 2947]